MRSLSMNTLETIYNHGILPSVLYGILIWGSSSSISEVNQIHIRAARYIKRIKKTVRDEDVLQAANWKPIQFYYKRTMACKIFKIYKGTSAPLLTKLITKSRCSRQTRNKFKIDNATFKYVLFKRSFTFRAPKIWNSITNDIRETNSYDCFKRKLTKSEDLHKITFDSSSIYRALDYNDFVYH